MKTINISEKIYDKMRKHIAGKIISGIDVTIKDFAEAAIEKYIESDIKDFNKKGKRF